MNKEEQEKRFEVYNKLKPGDLVRCFGMDIGPDVWSCANQFKCIYTLQSDSLFVVLNKTIQNRLSAFQTRNSPWMAKVLVKGFVGYIDFNDGCDYKIV